MFFESVQFCTWCFILSGILGVLGLFFLLSPAIATKALSAFPRSRVTGMVLSTAAILWGGGILYWFPLDFLEGVRKYMPLVFIAAVPLSWWFLKDLLACRAFGGLLALLPAPVFLAARFQDTPWRLVLVVLMYIFAVAGMFIILYPYLLRDWLKWLTDKPLRLKICALILVLLSIVLAGIGIFA